MISNMQLEDVLTILGRAGSVTLRKGTHDVSASPGFKADTEGWTCEITLKGYLQPWGHGGAGGSILRLTGAVDGEVSRPRGMSALEAAKRTLDELESFLDSPEGERCRGCYVEQCEFYGHEIAPPVKIDWG